MKTNLATVEVESSGVSATASFSIKANGKAFQILSSGLYSDKPLAVVRELSCNALDAHVAAGKAHVPFQVHLPNDLEPWFSVKDEGTGLSHDGVMKLYTTYFESTKGDSNDFIGALGLGSKSPFSYVDSFTVISRHEAWRRTYTAYIGESGMPTIALMDEVETDEENGIEVLMPVETKDFYTFRYKVEAVLRRFDPLPIVVGARCDLKAPVYSINGPSWGLRKSDSACCVAIQGTVPYPISKYAAQWTDEEKETLALDLDIRFDIGELEVAALREALQYDPRTIAAIRARLAVIATELPEHFLSHFDQCETAWEARLQFWGLSQSLGQNLLKVLEKNLKWRGKPINSSQVVDISDLNDVHMIHLSEKECSRCILPLQKPLSKWTLQAKDGYRIYWDNCGTRVGFQRKLRQDIAHIYNEQVIIIATADPAVLHIVLTRMGNPPGGAINIAEIELPPKAPKQPSVRTSYKKVFEWDINRWYERTIDVSEGGYFVHLHSGDPQYKGIICNNASTMLRDGLQLGIYEGPVYGIPAGSKSIITQNKGWIEVLPLIEAEVRKRAKDPTLGAASANATEINQWRRDKLVELLRKAVTPLRRLKAPAGRLAAGLAKLQANSAHDPLLEPLLRQMRLFNIPVKEKKPIVSIRPLMDAVRTAYPLVQVTGYYDEFVEQWMEYINFIDTRRI